MGIFSSRVVFAMVWRPLALGSRSLVRARLRDLALRRTNLTYGRRVSSDCTMIPLSAAGLGRRDHSSHRHF